MNSDQLKIGDFVLQLSNPRTNAVIENWPFGKKRVTATFQVEINKRGERVTRATTGKPKFTTYHLKIRIVDGDDGKTYLLGLTEYGQIVVIPGTMKGTTYYHKGEEYDAYKAILLDAN